MLYYTEFGLSHLEVPGERCISIYISGCRHNCHNCHYPELRRIDYGLPLNQYFKDILDLYQTQATCICFLGEGEESAETRGEFITYARLAHRKGLRTCLYSGRDINIEKWMRCFDYVKLGSYQEEFGPLDSPVTNQRMYKLDATNNYRDITHKFLDHKEYNNMHQISIKKIGVTRLDTDCVVNAANSGLWEGGGVCGAIFKEAGSPELTRACKAIGFCAEGSAVITPGFKLKAKYIIHAVGPRWNGGHSGEEKLLYSCYQSAMKLAQENNCHSIGFPLISAGIFGYPKQQAWEVAVKSIQDYFSENPGADISVVFAVLDDDILKMGNDVLCQSKPTTSKFTFFWHEYEENGCFSQWYSVPFTIEGITYQTCEQYMMAKKALMFDDVKHYYQIMAASDPQECKKLGREVRNFESARWDAAKDSIIFNANLAKFSQNADLKAALLATGDTILAEASPFDTIWGIGLKASDPLAKDPTKWRGTNLLGETLMKVREFLTVHSEILESPASDAEALQLSMQML